MLIFFRTKFFFIYIYNDRRWGRVSCHTKCKPDQFSLIDDYWTQPDKQSIYIDLILFLMKLKFSRRESEKFDQN